VVVVEKGSEVGAHILSGCGDRSDRARPPAAGMARRGHPIKTAVATTASIGWAIGGAAAAEFHDAAADVEPRQLYRVARQRLPLARDQGRSAGVEIYPGFAAAELLIENGAVMGVATGDMGIGKNGEPRSDFTRGMELRAKYTLFAEGARGSLSKLLIAQYGLDQGRQPQKFGIGLKELWQVAPEKHRPGLVQHIFGLAARQFDRRRLVPLSLRRQAGIARLCRPSQLLQSVSVAIR
jgi:electron-transferring-flavoprotein dehydrogenase